MLVLSDSLTMVWRLDGDEQWEQEKAALVRGLIEVSQGRPAVSDSLLASMPRVSRRPGSSGP